MTDEFKLSQIYDHNLNFLIGSGASNGFLPTLELAIKDQNKNKCTFETLAKEYEYDKTMTTILFMLYYQQCIQPGLPHNDSREVLVESQKDVIHEYKKFLQTLIHVLNKQKDINKKANVFTTNYDNCFETAGEKLMQERQFQFEINDGSNGFQTLYFHTKNFNNRVVHEGVFNRHNHYLPQINLLHAHGSIHWQKGRKDDDIQINYNYDNNFYNIQFSEAVTETLNNCKSILYDENKTLDDLTVFKETVSIDENDANKFWDEYKKIPIVNPTKWKFYETIFEEAYYQILRHLSYELERPHSILIVFGFSFADEHILSLIKRALSNPTLTMYIFCFEEQQQKSMKEKFKEYPNVKLIYSSETQIDFKTFNDKYFTVEELSKPENGGLK